MKDIIHIPPLERVSGAASVRQWLKRSMERAVPMQLQMEDAPQPLTVKVLGLNTQQHWIRLAGDELQPELAHAQRFNIAAMNDNGSVYLFSGHWEPDDHSMPGEYVIAEPEFIDVVQWREFFRVPTPKNCDLVWVNSASKRLQARVLNLSLGGFRIHSPAKAGERLDLAEGCALKDCQIVTNDERLDLGNAKVQYYFRDADDTGWMIGCAFEKAASQQLSRLIMSLQIPGSRV